MKIKIVPADSSSKICSSHGVKVFNDEGIEIEDIIEINVNYKVDEIVTATLTIAVNPEGIEANPMLSLLSLKEAAFHHGLELVPIVETNIENVFCGMKEAAKKTKEIQKEIQDREFYVQWHDVHR